MHFDIGRPTCLPFEQFSRRDVIAHGQVQESISWKNKKSISIDEEESTDSTPAVLSLHSRLFTHSGIYIHYRAIHKTKKALNVIMIILEASLANRRPLQQIKWYGTCSLKFNQCTRIQIFHF